MSILDCFGDIVGLSQDFDSDSGLYITDLEAVSTIEGLTAEEGRDFVSILEDARRVAVTKLNTDLVSLMSKYVAFRKPVYGKIGSSRWKGTTKGGGEFLIVCRPLRSATLHLDTIGVMFDTTGVFNVTLSTNIPGVADVVLPVNAVANTLTVTNVNRVLPMYNRNVDFVEYRLSHDQDYLDSKLVCSSCRRFSFSYNNPTFAEQGTSAYVNVAAVKGSSYMNSSAGFVLGVQFECRTDTLICDGAFDYTNDPMAMTYAQAVQYKAGSVVVWNCLRNQHLNRILMQNADDLREAAKYYERKYNDIIGYVNKHRDYTHDCICNKRGAWIGRKR